MKRAITCALAATIRPRRRPPGAGRRHQARRHRLHRRRAHRLDLKFFMDNTNALEFGSPGRSRRERNAHPGRLPLHRYGLIDLTNGDEMPLYFGIGARMILIDNFDDIVGIRFPIGLAYMFHRLPFDIFGEVVPILDLAPDTDFDLEGAVGARFWF